MNPGERRLHDLLRRAGLVGWRAGVTVRDADGRPRVVDVLFEGARVVVELDGYRAHADRRAFENDRSRQNALQLAGYVVLRFTWRDLTTRPDAVAAQIRAALATSAKIPARVTADPTSWGPA